MTTKAKLWARWFLALTAMGVIVPTGMEIYAAFDSDPDTAPWTEYISKNVPWPVAIAVYIGLVVLMVWLVPHFIYHYRYWRERRRSSVD